MPEPTSKPMRKLNERVSAFTSRCAKKKNGPYTRNFTVPFGSGFPCQTAVKKVEQLAAWGLLAKKKRKTNKLLRQVVQQHKEEVKHVTPRPSPHVQQHHFGFPPRMSGRQAGPTPPPCHLAMYGVPMCRDRTAPTKTRVANLSILPANRQNTARLFAYSVDPCISRIGDTLIMKSKNWHNGSLPKSPHDATETRVCIPSHTQTGPLSTLSFQFWVNRLRGTFIFE